jgi:hypothetical protein
MTRGLQERDVLVIEQMKNPPDQAGFLVWQGWDLDPRPRAYESPALPLSYLAEAGEYYYGLFLLSTLTARRTRRGPISPHRR